MNTPTARAAETDDLPPPSPELVMLRVLLEAHLATLPRRKAIRFLEAANELFEQHDQLRNAYRLRADACDGQVQEARRLARNWFDRLVSVYLRRLG